MLYFRQNHLIYIHCHVSAAIRVINPPSQILTEELEGNRRGCMSNMTTDALTLKQLQICTFANNVFVLIIIIRLLDSLTVVLSIQEVPCSTCLLQITIINLCEITMMAAIKISSFSSSASLHCPYWSLWFIMQPVAHTVYLTSLIKAFSAAY